MVDARDGTADLDEQVRALTAENERLKADAAPGQVWRSALVVVLLALGTVLSPAAVVAGWARLQLTTADAFVDTFAPLSDDPQVQALVAGQVVGAINGAVDIPGLTNDVFAGIDQLGLPPRAAAALRLLQAPATQGIQSFISGTVDDVVRSAAFRDLWRQGLRTAHGSLVGLQGDLDSPDRAVTVSGTGEIGVQLRPIIAAVKARLVARGVALASSIPEIDRVIVVAKTDAVPTIRTVYATTVAVGTWLPFLVLALFAGAILLSVGAAGRWSRQRYVCSRRWSSRPRGSGWAGSCSPARCRRSRSPPAPPTSSTRRRSRCCAARSWPSAPSPCSSPSPPGSPVRRDTPSGCGGWRSTAPRPLVEPPRRAACPRGRFGVWVGAHARAIRVVIAVAAAAVILLLRPLSFSDVVWVAVGALVALLLVLFLGRPRTGVPAQQGEDAHTPSFS